MDEVEIMFKSERDKRMKSADEIRKEILEFRDERNWKQFHTPKDLAISIALEAAELLEVFQWSGKDLVVESKREKVEEELADVLIYCSLMADAMGMDVGEIITKKLERNREKYPIEKSYGNADKYTELNQ